MKNQAQVINEFDQNRLAQVIEQLRVSNYYAQWDNGDELQFRLNTAKKLAPVEVPEDLITMNSTVLVRDTTTKKEQRYTIVFPTESDPIEGKISVLSKLGLALFGSRVGDIVEFTAPSGQRRLEVCTLEYQPEAAHDYDR